MKSKKPVVEEVKKKPMSENKEQVLHNCREEEYKAKYLRALADYQNLEKRMESVRRDAAANGIKNFVLDLLPFLDNLDRAEAFIKDPALVAIRQSLLQVLNTAGFIELDVLNKEFDPYTAEVIDMVEGQKENEVVKVLRKGFSYQGAVIRVAQVIVGRKKI